MRKGKGELTDVQRLRVNQMLRRENKHLRERLEKLQHDYDSLKAAHNKMLKDKETLDGMPNVKRALRTTERMYEAMGGRLF